MKFALTIWICSFLNLTCSPPIKIPQYFDSWKECVVAAQQLSVELINTTDDINQYRLATKYICKEVYVQGA